MARRAASDKELDSLQPPQSVDAEQAVLGAIMKDNEAIHQVIEVLEDESHFYSPKHQTIFRAVLELYRKTEAIDITTVSNQLLSTKRLESIGGRVYLVDLIEGIISTAHVEAHAKIVLEKSMLRNLIATSNEIARSAYEMDVPAESLLDAAEANIFKISQLGAKRGFTAMHDMIHPVWQEVEAMQQSGEGLSGVSSGFREIDNLTQGLHKGDLIIVAGRPSMGKTAFAMNVAENIAMNPAHKHAVAVFSVEMSKEQLALRLMCSRARVSQSKLRSGKFSDADWRNFTNRSGPLGDAQIFIDDSPSLSALEMRAKARRLHAQHELSLIIVDYIQIMNASGRFENRQQEISYISRNLKSLAKELNVPLIAISQLSRGVEQRGGDKRPQLSDLRESGAIEQDADLVMFVSRPEMYMSDVERNDPKNRDKLGVAEIIIAKQRNGPTGDVTLSFLKEFTRFENLAPGYREIPNEGPPTPDSNFL